MNSWEETFQVEKSRTMRLTVDISGTWQQQATIDDLAAWYKAQTSEDQKRLRLSILATETPKLEARIREISGCPEYTGVVEHIRKLVESKDELSRRLAEYESELPTAEGVGLAPDWVNGVSVKDYEALYAEYRRSIARRKKVEEKHEQLIAQLSKCSICARGVGGSEQDCREGDYEWSPVFEDMKRLRERCEKAESELRDERDARKRSEQAETTG